MHSKAIGAATGRAGTHHRRLAPLRGRDAELELIGEALGAAAAGRGSVLLLDGPAGIGKTRLLAEATVMAGRNGLRMATGRPPSAAAPMPFAPLLGALFDGRRPLFPATVLRDLSTRADQRYWLVQGIQALIEEAALDGPLLIALDDLQWADTETLVALRTVTAALEGLPITWMLAARAGEAAADVRAALPALLLDGGRRVRLGGLDDDAVGQVVGDVLGGAASASLIGLTARARGNPFLLVELLEGLREDGMVRRERGRVDLVADGLPGRLRDAMLQRLDRLAPETAQMLRVASILRRFSIEHVAALLAASPATLLAPVEDALRADLLTDTDGQLAFRHDLLREAVATTLPASMRRTLQRQAADVLTAAGGDPLTVAAHLVASADKGDREAAARLRAAAQTLAASDAGRAADLSRQALALTFEDDPAWGGLVAETVVLLHAVMRGDEADALAATALDRLLPAEQEADVRLSLATLSLRSADKRAADNRRALALTGVSAGLRARHGALLAQNVALAGRFAEARPLLARAVAAAQACGDVRARAAVRLTEVTLEEADGRYDGALARLQHDRGRPRAIPRMVEDDALQVAHARVLAATGRLGEGLKLSSVGMARARRDHRSWLLGCWSSWRSQLLLDAGALGDAGVEAEAALALADGAAGLGTDLDGALILGRIALHTGDAKRVRSSLRRARELHACGVPMVRRHAAWLLALVAFDDGRAGDALAWLADDELPYAAPFADVTHPPMVVRMALAAGQPAIAAAAVQRAESFARGNGGNALLAGVAANARGLCHGRLDDLLEAVALLRGAGRPLVLAAALEDAADALLAAGRREAALQAAGEASDTWEQTGAIADARRMRRRLRALGVHRRAAVQVRPKQGWASLTESELAVVRLVAEGHTNRQVAQRLVLSPHTVSTHLRHAFTKLKINSRVELARIALDPELAEASAA